MRKPKPKYLAIGGAAAAAVVGTTILLASIGGGGDTVVPDAGKTGTMSADLLTRPVVPGELVITSVHVPLGMQATNIEYVGAASGMFATELLTSELTEDEVAIRIVVQARNTSDVTIRLTALVYYQPASEKQ